MALQQSSKAAKEKVLGNMSQRVRAFMEGELAAAKPAAPEEIARAQERVLQTTALEAAKIAEQVKNRIAAVWDQVVRAYQKREWAHQ